MVYDLALDILDASFKIFALVHVVLIYVLRVIMSGLISFRKE
jgi:hypothetical protein